MLKALNEHERHDWFYLAMMIGPELLWLVSNPGMTIRTGLRSLKWKKNDKREAAPLDTDGVQTRNLTASCRPERVRSQPDDVQNLSHN